jgi:CYTH domain-containing protein
VRVRIKDALAYLTIKGITNESGFVLRGKRNCPEAEQLLKLCEKVLLVKQDLKSK